MWPHVGRLPNLQKPRYVIGRDPQLYKDPLVFRPERWIPFEQPPPHEFPVFQAGPRICLGRRNGWMGGLGWVDVTDGTRTLPERNSHETPQTTRLDGRNCPKRKPGKKVFQSTIY